MQNIITVFQFENIKHLVILGSALIKWRELWRARQQPGYGAALKSSNRAAMKPVPVAAE